LVEQVERVLAKRESVQKKRIARGLVPAIFIYGGGLHNDVSPLGKDKSYSYAERVAKRVDGRYIEIDLFVPELIKGSLIYAGQPWFETANTIVHRQDVLLFKRGPSSYVIILKHHRFVQPSQKE